MLVHSCPFWRFSFLFCPCLHFRSVFARSPHIVPRPSSTTRIYSTFRYGTINILPGTSVSSPQNKVSSHFVPLLSIRMLTSRPAYVCVRQIMRAERLQVNAQANHVKTVKSHTTNCVLQPAPQHRSKAETLPPPEGYHKRSPTLLNLKVGYNVPLLDDDGENYIQWSKIMKLVLRHHGL
jgi:hypothetical protein